MSLDIQFNIDLKKYNSWKVGGQAEYFCLPTNMEDLNTAYTFSQDNKLKVTILGSGSNVLIPDAGIAGLVICLKKLKGLFSSTDEKTKRLCVEAMAGETKNSVMKVFLQHNLPPAIFLSGLPGDIGGGIVMNAGISEKILPREFVDITDWIEVFRDGKVMRFSKEELTWSYRHCMGWQPGIIVKVGMSWNIDDVDLEIKQKAQNFSKSRMERQPLEMPSCGSTFVNPPGNSAGKLIEECGLKGFSIGGAQVSPKHANFLVNTGTAKASDIKALIQHIQKTVLEKKGVQLKTEVVSL